MGRRTILAGTLLGLGLCSPNAIAQGTTGPVPPNNDFALDLYQGPVLAPIRVTGLGGAYAGYAEGIAGFVANAASPALRAAHSASWLEPDLDASFSIPISLFANNDFDDSGDLNADYQNFVYLTAGGQLQVGDFGLGLCGDLQRYDLVTSAGSSTIVLVGRYHGLLGWQFAGDQLVLGAGVRVTTLGISAPGVELTMAGASPQFGFIVRPDWLPFRVGATYRHSVAAETSLASTPLVDAQGIEHAGGLVLPARAELPWELEVGFALQVGPRPLNPSWINPHDHEQELRDSVAARAAARKADARRRLLAIGDDATRAELGRAIGRELGEQEQAEQAKLERDVERLADERRARAANWPRERLLLTAELLVTGQVDNAMGLHRFLAQGLPRIDTRCEEAASGEDANFSPRFGLEMEPVPMWVQTRFGGYYEPNRFSYEGAACSARPGRQHFTFGADLKLFSTTWFGLVSEVTYKLQSYGDLAPRYQAFGLGFGVWR